MLFGSANFYAQWRGRMTPPALLREGDPAPPERLLQQIWLHQRLKRDGLTATDGRPLRILHPGFWNHEAGPDFQQAIVQFGSEPPVVGAIEIDLAQTFWRGHGHDENQRYRAVVLHVVWDGPVASPAKPVLLMRPCLDAPLPELALWFAGEGLPQPTATIGQCSAPLRELGVGQMAELLRQAAEVRLHRKATQLQARARETGWEQTFWEFTLAALGYKHNLWPMRRLAELTPWRLAGSGRPLALEARLLGLGNLLPADSGSIPSPVDGHLRRLWDSWWRDTDAAGPWVLPRSGWRMAGLRPANQPARRLALAAGWLGEGRLIERLEAWLLRPLPAAALVETLEEALTVSTHEFWESHWTFRSAPLAQPQPLLGSSRATDLAINVIIPWFWMRAVAGQNETLRRVAEQRYFEWPAAQDNATLKLARQRLLGQTRSALFATAAAQQGLLQITRDFCDHSNALCEACPFPELVKAWQVKPL